MKKRVFLHILSTLLFTLIPGILSYLANSELAFQKLIDNGILSATLDIATVQDHCLWVGIILSTILLSFNLLITKIKNDSILEQRNSLIKMNKNILLKSLKETCIPDLTDFDIRFFIPKHPFLYKLCDFLNFRWIKKKFAIKNISLIAEAGLTKNLQFEVFPKQEGLVGKCYKKKNLVYDDNLDNTNNTEYGLDENQISRTSDLKWSICCPIFDNNNNIVAIMALDGLKRITIEKTKEGKLKRELNSFSRTLLDSVPQLFKRHFHN